MFDAFGIAYLGTRASLNWVMSDSKPWLLGFAIVDKDGGRAGVGRCHNVH